MNSHRWMQNCGRLTFTYKWHIWRHHLSKGCWYQKVTLKICVQLPSLQTFLKHELETAKDGYSWTLQKHEHELEKDRKKPRTAFVWELECEWVKLRWTEEFCLRVGPKVSDKLYSNSMYVPRISFILHVIVRSWTDYPVQVKVFTSTVFKSYAETERAFN